MIDERPAVVEERSRIGDWEMYTMIGRPGGKVLVTMVERKRRYTLIGLAENKEAAEVTARSIQPRQLRWPLESAFQIQLGIR